ncbi:MAG: hypothetical protein ACREL5_05095 [Gemmatimonadales bacterium]
MRARIAALAGSAVFALAPAMAAQEAPGAQAAPGGALRVLIVSGLSAEPLYVTQFRAIADTIFDAARARWHVADSNLLYLAEDSTADPRVTGRSTKQGIAGAFASFASRTRSGDVTFVLLIGHGSGELDQSALNVPGPDPVARDFAGWLASLQQGSVVFVDASNASGDFGPVLAGPGRVIITATRTALERNATIFGDAFAAALTGTAADANKDGTVSVAEAFDAARAEVAREYDETRRLQTEHAVMIDSSGIASRIGFGGAATSADPRVIALVGERRTLEGQVDSLRHIKATMDSTSYQRELERLLLLVARKTRTIDSLRRTAPP